VRLQFRTLAALVAESLGKFCCGLAADWQVSAATRERLSLQEPRRGLGPALNGWLRMLDHADSLGSNMREALDRGSGDQWRAVSKTSLPSTRRTWTPTRLPAIAERQPDVRVFIVTTGLIG